MNSNNASSTNEYRASKTHAHNGSNNKSNYVKQFKTIYPAITIDDAFKCIENLDFKRIKAIQKTQVKEIFKCRPDTDNTSKPATIAKRHSTDISIISAFKPDSGRTSEPATRSSDAAETLKSSTLDGGKPSKLAITAKKQSHEMIILKKLKPDADVTPKPAIIAKQHSNKPESTSLTSKQAYSAKGNIDKPDNLRSFTPGEGIISSPAISPTQHLVKTENLSKLDDGYTSKSTLTVKQNSNKFENSRKNQEKRTFYKLDNFKMKSTKYERNKKMEWKQDRKVKEKENELTEKHKKNIQSEKTNRKKSRTRPKLTLKDKLFQNYFKRRGIYRNCDKSLASKEKPERQRLSDIDAGSPEDVLTRYHAAKATENAVVGEAKRSNNMDLGIPTCGECDEDEHDMIILNPEPKTTILFDSRQIIRAYPDSGSVVTFKGSNNMDLGIPKCGECGEDEHDMIILNPAPKTTILFDSRQIIRAYPNSGSDVTFEGSNNMDLGIPKCGECGEDEHDMIILNPAPKTTILFDSRQIIRAYPNSGSDVTFEESNTMSYATPSNPDDEEDDLIILSSDTEDTDVYEDTGHIDRLGAKGLEEASRSLKQPTNNPLEAIRKRNTIILGSRKPAAATKPEVTTSIHEPNKNKINNTTLKKGIDKVIVTNSNLNNVDITNLVTSATYVRQRSLNLKDNKGLIGMKIAFASTEPESSNEKSKNIKLKKALHTLHNVRSKRCTVTALKSNIARKRVFKSKASKTPAVLKTIKKPKDIQQKNAAASGTKIFKSHYNQTKNAEKTAKICKGESKKIVGIIVPGVKKSASFISSKCDELVVGSQILQPQDKNNTPIKQHNDRYQTPQTTTQMTDTNECNKSSRATCITKDVLDKRMSYTKEVKATVADRRKKQKTRAKNYHKKSVKMENARTEDDLHINGVTIVKDGPASTIITPSSSKNLEDALEIRILRTGEIIAKEGDNMAKEITKRDFNEAEKDLLTSAKYELHLNGVSIVTVSKSCAPELKILSTEEIKGSTADDMTKKVTKDGFKEAVKNNNTNLKDDLFSNGVTIVDAESASKNIAPSTPKKAKHAPKATSEDITTKYITKNYFKTTNVITKSDEKTEHTTAKDDLHLNQITIIKAGSVSNNIACSTSTDSKEAMDSRTSHIEDMATKVTKDILKVADKSEDCENLNNITTDLVSKKIASSTSRNSEEVLDSRIQETKKKNGKTAKNTTGKLTKDYLKEAEMIREILDTRSTHTKEINPQTPNNTTKSIVTNDFNTTKVLVNSTSVKNYKKEQFSNNTIQKNSNENKLPQAHITIFYNSDGSIGHTTEYPNKTPSPKLNMSTSTELHQQWTKTPSRPEISTVIIAPPKPSEHKDVKQLDKDTSFEIKKQQRPVQKHKPPYQQPIHDAPNQSMPLSQKEQLSAIPRMQSLADGVQLNPCSRNMQHLPNYTCNPLQTRETSLQNTAYNSVKYAAGNMNSISSQLRHVNNQRYELPAQPLQDIYNMRYTMNDAANWSQSPEKYQPANVNIPSHPQFVNNNGRQVMPGQPPQNKHNKSSNYALHRSQEKYPPHNVNMSSLPQHVNALQQVLGQRSQDETSMQHQSQEKYPPGNVNIASPPQMDDNQQRHMLPGQLQDRHQMPCLSTNSVHASQSREEYIHNSFTKLTQNLIKINNQRHLLPGQQQDHNMGHATSNVLNRSPQQGNYAPANLNKTRQMMPVQLPQDKHMRHALNHTLRPQQRYISPNVTIQQLPQKHMQYTLKSQERYICPNVTIQPMPPLCSKKQFNSRCAQPQSVQNLYSSNNASQPEKNTPNTNVNYTRDFAAQYFPGFTHEPTSYLDLYPPVNNINYNCNITYTNEDIQLLSAPHRRKKTGTDNENPSKRRKPPLPLTPIEYLNTFGTPTDKGPSSRKLRLLSVEEVNSTVDTSKIKSNRKHSPSSNNSSKDTCSNSASYGISVDKGPLPPNTLQLPLIPEMNSSVSAVENVKSKIAPSQAPNTSQDGTRRPRYEVCEENENEPDLKAFGTSSGKGTPRVLRLRSILDVNSSVDGIEKVTPKIPSSQEANNSSEDHHRRPDVIFISQQYLPNTSTLSRDLEVIDPLDLNNIEKVELKMEYFCQEPKTSSEDNNYSGADLKEDVIFDNRVDPPNPAPQSEDLKVIDPLDPLDLSNVVPSLNSTTKGDNSKLENVVDLTKDYLVVRKNNKFFAVTDERNDE